MENMTVGEFYRIQAEAGRRAFRRLATPTIGDFGKSFEYILELELEALHAKSAKQQDLARARKQGESEVSVHRMATPAANPAQTPATPAPVVPASDGPAKRGNRKPAWATVAMPYMKSLFTAGHYKSAAVFYKALMSRACESDSPFKLVNRELYCTEAGTTVSNGALGNVWPEIRAH